MSAQPSITCIGLPSTTPPVRSSTTRRRHLQPRTCMTPTASAALFSKRAHPAEIPPPSRPPRVFSSSWTAIPRHRANVEPPHSSHPPNRCPLLLSFLPHVSLSSGRTFAYARPARGRASTLTAAHNTSRVCCSPALAAHGALARPVVTTIDVQSGPGKTGTRP